MIWGIIGAMDQEIDMLRQSAVISHQETRYGCTFYRGRIEGQEVVLVCCGVGKVNAAICAMTLIHSFGVERILHVGIAGSLSPKVDCLDLVIASDAVYHDIEPGVLIDYFPHCDRFPCDPGLIKLAETVCRPLTEAQGHRTVVGHLVSGDRFISDPDKKQRLAHRFEAICVEMEGAAVAHVCYVHQVPFLILRIISDSVREGVWMEYQTFKPLACQQSSAIVRAFLQAF